MVPIGATRAAGVSAEQNSAPESAFRLATLGVVGNLNRDIKTTPLPPSERLFTDGETSVESILETMGGGGANAACIAAALGARVAFLAKVGSDALGTRLEQTLLRHGVEPHLARDPGVATGTTVALAFDNGHRHFLSCLPNNEALRFEDLDLGALNGFQHLYRADLWFSQPMLWGGNERLFREARARGLAVSIDLNWDPRWGVGDADEIRARKQAVRAVLPLVHFAHGNARELKEFTDAPDLDTALRRLEDWGVEAVILHLGAEGAGYYHRGRLVVEPAVPATTQVNTTGTGDVLSVCLMLLHRQPDVPAQLRLANRIVTEFIEGKRAFIPALDQPARNGG
jgi:sugar/nucleoside kinase (ribokinase family)